MSAGLSVIIIVKNEARRIRICLESIKWANEIIVLDSGSSDDTVKICQEYTDKVFITDWPGYGPQKKRALQKATQDWVLSLDADEWLPEPTQQEIKQLLLNPEADAYQMKRINFFWGKPVKYGDFRADVVLRLFKRTSGQISEALVHEKVMVDGPIKTLKNTLFHDISRTIENGLNRLNNYTTLIARNKAQHGHTGNIWKAIFHGIWAFFKSYFLRLGLLNGTMGFVIAVFAAENGYYKYIKLHFINRQLE